MKLLALIFGTTIFVIFLQQVKSFSKAKSLPLLDPALNVASSTLDMLCTSTISIYNALQTQSPDINKMNFQLMTGCQNYSVPLKEAEKLIRIKGVSRSKRFVFFAPGWRNTIENSNAIVEMADAFFCRNDVNFVAIDFASYMDTMYKSAAINTEEIGAAIAIGLAKLIKLVPILNIHLVGHSLGAHIMGAAGRSFKSLTNGRQIPRITGLDPAKPCFGNEEILGSLGRGDARLVDIIHTNNGVLGIRKAIGDIDFYPGPGLVTKQPGCATIDCSHSRAVAYFIESIIPKNEQNFPAYKCASFNALELGMCTKFAGNFFMGYKLNSIKPGIFQVYVHNEAPFGVKAKSKVKPNCQWQRRRICKGNKWGNQKW